MADIFLIKSLNISIADKRKCMALFLHCANRIRSNVVYVCRLVRVTSFLAESSALSSAFLFLFYSQMVMLRYLNCLDKFQCPFISTIQIYPGIFSFFSSRPFLNDVFVVVVVSQLMWFKATHNVKHYVTTSIQSDLTRTAKTKPSSKTIFRLKTEFVGKIRWNCQQTNRQAKVVR